MVRHLFIAIALVVVTAGVALAKDVNLRKVDAKILGVRFCSTERESVCVDTDKGELALMSPYSGAIDGDSFKELFYLLHLVEDDTVTLVLVDDNEIVGIKTPHFEFIAPETDLKTLTPRKMP